MIVSLSTALRSCILEGLPRKTSGLRLFIAGAEVAISETAVSMNIRHSDGLHYTEHVTYIAIVARLYVCHTNSVSLDLSATDSVSRDWVFLFHPL